LRQLILLLHYAYSLMCEWGVTQCYFLYCLKE
jgi:hypothetical protein